jgi:peroxisomal membrane protein 4
MTVQLKFYYTNYIKLMTQNIFLNNFFNAFKPVPGICDHQNCAVSSIKGFLNGLWYGGKVRLIHSLVIEILFSKTSSLLEKLRNILKPTFEHSLNLGVFVLIYKTTVCLLRRFLKTNSNVINFIAGVIGSYFIWTKKTSVNVQIMLYLLSRNLLAISTILSNKYFPNFQYGFSLTSMMVWGIVMYLFEVHPGALQSSLKQSMDFIYKESNK